MESLDDRGFLPLSTAQIADLTGLDEDEIDAVLDIIREVAPVGVAAHDLRECLLMQTAWLRENGHDLPYAVIPIIDTALEAFGAHKYGQIARDLGIAPEAIDERHKVTIPSEYNAKIQKTTRVKFSTGQQEVSYHLLKIGAPKTKSTNANKKYS